MPKRPGRKSAAQTPAPRSERIYGSKKNKPGSASSQSEAKISLSPQIKKALKKKADEFNEKHPTKRVRVTTLEKVFRRGAGAYSKSHRPTITGNVPNTRSAWSFARVNKFLKKKSGQKVKAAYVQDDDLLMDGGEVMAKGGLLIQYTSVPKYLYHATYKPLLNTIEKEGLGGTSAKRNWDFSEEGVIYLAIDDEVALSFAETADNVKDDWLDEIIILKIDTTKLDKTRFFIDRNLLDDYDLDDDFISFEYHGVIPFESVVDFYENNYSKGGEVKFNDKELLAKYNRGESIGFTAVAHLKAKGLIPRADGTKRKSEKYLRDGGLIAPNGKPSNLTHEQWHLVRTPEFKAWFGDWENDPDNASKVVDDNGEPLVVIHKTTENFNVFDKDKIGEANKFTILDGFFFGNYKSKSEGLRNIESFLNLKNPIILNESNTFFDSVGYQEAVANFIVNGTEDYLREYLEYEEKSNIDYILSKWEKADGVIVKNLRYSGFDTELVAFEPNQIKLADGTNTTFDGTNPDIRYNDGGVVFVRNKNYDNSQTIRRLPYRGVSAFAVATDDFEKFKQYAEKEEGVDPSNWQVYDMDDFDNYQVCAMKMSETNDYVMGWSDDKPKLEPFDAQEHTMYIDEDGNLDYDDAHEIIILPTKTMDRGGMTAIFVNNMLESAKDIDNIIEYALENDIKPTDPEFNTKVNPDGKYSAFEIRLAKRELKKYSHGGELPMQVTCKKCGWSWNTADSQPQDATMCHKCGFDNVSEDIISMNAPTYLRSLEFAREDAKEDVDLHKVTENAVALSKEHPIRMKEYDELVKLENGGVLPELTDEELAFMRKMMKSSPLLRKFMDSEEITIANRLVKKGWLEKGTSSDTPHSVIYLVELKPADIEKYGLDEYADGGQLFAYEPKEYDIQEFICKEQDLADVVSNRGDMTKLGKIRVCQAKINLAEDKLKNATSDREVEAWYMSTCIWTDCMNGLKSNYKSGGKVGGCGCYKDGGLAYGNSHDKGGMPLTVKSTGQNIEIEGGEGVVNKRSMQMNKTVEFQGKKLTPCEVVSKINEMGGGVKFKCDDVKKIIAEDGHFD